MPNCLIIIVLCVFRCYAGCMIRDQIKQLIESRVSADGMVETGVKGVQLFRVSSPLRCAPVVYKPNVAAIVSGEKEALLGGERFVFDSSHYMCCTLSMRYKSKFDTYPAVAEHENFQHELPHRLYLGASMQSQTLIAVADVKRASQWYQTLLGCQSLHGGEQYDRLAMPGERGFFLQLHAWEAHDHPNISDANAGPHGHGVLLWFLVDDFVRSAENIKRLNPKIVVEPHINLNANQHEIWIEDLDGYTVVIAAAVKE